MKMMEFPIPDTPSFSFAKYYGLAVTAGNNIKYFVSDSLLTAFVISKGEADMNAVNTALSHLN